MAHNGFKIMDSDMHTMEPVDLWERYIDPEFKDRAPRGRNEFIGDLRMLTPEGDRWGRARTNPQEDFRRDGTNFHAVQDRYKYFDDRGWTAEVHLEAMDQEGIDRGVLYPSRGLFALSIPDMDPKLAAAVARAYNNWLYDYCQADPDRLAAAAMISAFNVDDGVAEALRCVKELGFKGIFLRPNEVNGRNWYDPYYEPLWSTIEELGVPIGFHEGSGSALRQVGEQFGYNSMLRHVFCHPTEQMLATASFCGGGILERHPNLKVGFLEGNCSWLPFLLWRLDEHWEREGDVHAPELTMAPSEYFKRQCYASVEPDEDPAKYAIDFMGSDRFVFSGDFPHGDSKFPNAVETFLTLPFSETDKRKILWDNCSQFYGYE